MEAHPLIDPVTLIFKKLADVADNELAEKCPLILIFPEAVICPAVPFITTVLVPKVANPPIVSVEVALPLMFPPTIRLSLTID